MGLEAATYISQLVATNPVGATDPRSQGDDHLRLVKLVLQNTLPALSGAVTATHSELNQLHGGVLTSLSNGNAGAPAYSFATDTNTGVFNAGGDYLGFSAGGAEALSIRNTGGFFGLLMNGTNSRLYLADGAAATPALTFIGDLNTGFYRAGADDFLAVANGTALLEFNGGSSVALRAQTRMSFNDGDAALPGLSFGSDLDTGIYRVTTDVIGLSAGGVLRWNFGSFGVRGPDGTASLPSYSFDADTNTGLYRFGADIVGIAAGGVTSAYFTATNTQFLDGSINNPGITFGSEQTSGLSRTATSTMVLSAGGAQCITVDNVNNSGLGQVRIHKQLYLDVNSSSSATTGAANALPANPQGYIAVTINGTQRRIPYYGD